MQDIETQAVTALQRKLARKIVQHLREDGLKPGETVNQLALATRFGVSRTPIRAALLVLAEAGIVSMDGRGVRAADLSVEFGTDDEEVDPIDDLIRRIASDRQRGQLPDDVSESDLMRRYNAPRAEIVAALRRLADLGLSARKPGFGWKFLASVESHEEKHAAYRFRLAIEPAALREPGYKADPSWVARMRAEHEDVLGRTWREVDAVAFFEMNAAFHFGLVSFSGNRFFIQAVEHQNRLRRLRNYSWRLGPERAMISTREHLSILDALAMDDVEEAARRLAHHLTSTWLTKGDPSAG
jgi:DNA-binding GntR family transcriptional regulator